MQEIVKISICVVTGLVMVFALFLLIAIFKCLLFAIFPSSFPSVKFSSLYYGRVKHTRLKGGAFHHLDYPIFFAFLDLQEMESIGMSFWPIFAINKPAITFCSFDHVQHLKDVPNASSLSILEKLRLFITSQSKNELNYNDFQRIQLLTHLTYFGYCFNPISIYYLKSPTNNYQTEAVIAEVSNTPWIEMHSYLLHSKIEKVEFKKKENYVQAIWLKAFHVSPFMEMDYKYDFTFYEPQETIKVNSKMLKLSTNETWFTANFELKQLPFTPLNLLYVLCFYPLQTRMIQVYIHYEAIKLFWKGVPTFGHPLNSDVDFGYGITGERLGAVLWILIAPFYTLYQSFFATTCSSSTSTSTIMKKVKSE
jgi:uncharacterized protein